MFQPVKPLFFFLNAAIPTVQDESLSYMEGVGKMHHKLNEVISELNQVPELIDEKIEAAFDESGLDDKIQQILADSIISVKNPPENIPPAKGDGVTNDTGAIQQIINYANNLGKPTFVEFPAGTYIVNTLEIKPNVSLVGENVYSTILKLTDYANITPLTGELNHVYLSNFTLDLNASHNATPLTGARFTVTDTSMLSTVRIVNAKTQDTALNLENNGNFIADELYIETGFVNLRGSGQALINGLCVSGATGLQVGSNYVIEGSAFLNTPVSVTGENNTIRAHQTESSPFNVTDPASNTLDISKHYNRMDVQTYSMDAINWSVAVKQAAILTAYSLTETFTGNKVVSAANSTETITGAKSVTANQITEVAQEATYQAGEMNVEVNTNLTVSSGDSLETVTNQKEENYGDLNTRVVGSSTNRVGGSYTEEITGEHTLKAAAEKVEAETINYVASSAAAFRAVHEIDITAEQIKLNSTHPLQYRAASKLNDHFNYLPFKAPDGSNIQVLVYNGSDPIPGPSPDPKEPPYINVKEHGAVGDGTTDDADAIINASNFNGYLYFPYGVYVVSKPIQLTEGILGIISEGATITSSMESGSLFSIQSSVFNIVNAQISAPNAEFVVNAGVWADDRTLFSSGALFNGNIQAANIIMSGCRVNNSSSIHAFQSGNYVGNILNANLVLTSSGVYNVSGNTINGSFVLQSVSDSAMVKGLAVTGNTFTTPTTVGDAFIQSLRIAGNVNMADYPAIVLPTPTPPFDYNIPDHQSLTFTGSDTPLIMQMNTLDNWMIMRNGKTVYYVGPEGTNNFSANVAVDGDLSVTGQINTNKGVHAVENIYTESSLGCTEDLHVYGTTNSHGQVINNENTLCKKDVTVQGFTSIMNGQVPFDHGVYFGSPENKDSYLFYTDLNKILRLMYYAPDATAYTVLQLEQNYPLFKTGLSVPVTEDGSKYMGTNGIQFTADYNQPNTHKIVENNSNGNLVFCYSGNPFNGFIESARVDLNGVWHFKNNIDAPNVGGGGGSRFKYYGRSGFELNVGEANATAITRPSLATYPPETGVYILVLNGPNNAFLNPNVCCIYRDTTIAYGWRYVKGQQVIFINGKNTGTTGNIAEIYLAQSSNNNLVYVDIYYLGW